MVVKQANITSYKVSDPGEILDRRPVLYTLNYCQTLIFLFISLFSFASILVIFSPLQETMVRVRVLKVSFFVQVGRICWIIFQSL